MQECSVQFKNRSKEKDYAVYFKTLRPGRLTERKTEGTAGRLSHKKLSPKAMGSKAGTECESTREC
jgi:hypothetical protein